MEGRERARMGRSERAGEWEGLFDRNVLWTLVIARSTYGPARWSSWFTGRLSAQAWKSHERSRSELPSSGNDVDTPPLSKSSVVIVVSTSASNHTVGVTWLQLLISPLRFRRMKYLWLAQTRGTVAPDHFACVGWVLAERKKTAVRSVCIFARTEPGEAVLVACVS